MCILYCNGLIKTGAEISFVLSSAYPRWKKNDIIVMYYMQFGLLCQGDLYKSITRFYR